MKRKLMAALLALVMVLCLMPTIAVAETKENCPGGEGCSHQAAIDTTHYNTLADAISAVSSSVTKTITLLKNSSGNGIVVPENSNFTVDFNGFTYTVNTDQLAGSSGTKTQCFQLLKDSTLIFENGAIVADNNAVKMIIQNYANLTLDNMTLDATNGTNNVSYVVSNNCGNVTIKDTTITAANNGVAFDVYGGFGNYNDVTVTVTGNSVINGKVEVARDTGTQNKNTLIINGGTINGELAVTPNVNTTVTINGGAFTDLAGAVKYAADNATITLLKDCSGAGIFLGEGSKNITIDLNNHTYTCTGPAVGSTGTQTQALHLEKGNTVTIKNGTITSTTDSGVKMLVQNYCNLTLDNVTLDGTNLPGSNRYVMSNNCGSVNINGNTSIKAGKGNFAFDSCGACWTNHPYGKGATVTVDTTGTIDGKIECCATIKIKNGTFTGDITLDSTTDKNCPKSVTITGGTFSSNPIDYVATGYAVSKNGDTYTVAAATNTAAVDVTNNGGKVTVANIVVNGEADTNTINVSSFETTEVQLPKTEMAKLTTATKPVEFVLNTNTAVEFNKEAVQAIAGKMTSATNITLVVKPDATVTNTNELTAKGKVANTYTEIVTLELKKDGNVNLFEAADGAKATVTVPFAMPAGCNRVNVYYLNSGTGKADYVGTASTANGTAAFTVEHFSSYALVPTYVGGSGSVPSGHTMTTNLSGITTVYVDGKKVDSKNYTISGGNVTLTQAYLNTLSAGKHTFKAENATHIATGTFNVAKGAVSPQTADAGIAIYGMMSIMSLMGMGYIGKKKSR